MQIFLQFPEREYFRDEVSKIRISEPRHRHYDDRGAFTFYTLHFTLSILHLHFTSYISPRLKAALALAAPPNAASMAVSNCHSRRSNAFFVSLFILHLPFNHLPFTIYTIGSVLAPFLYASVGLWPSDYRCVIYTIGSVPVCNLTTWR